jgi:phosphoenolpyruvate-protein phosphotransferase
MTTRTRRRSLQGVPAAAGAVHGRWVIVERAPLPAASMVAADEVDAEIDRLRVAAASVAAASDALAERVAADGAPDEAGIFIAHAEMARDPELVDVAANDIRARHVDAVGAVMAAAEAAAQMLRSLDDELLSGRAADVLDVAERIAREVRGLPPGDIVLDAPAIVVGRDMPPSVTATLPRDMLLGIALEGSSPTAHASILARAYRIPAAVAVSGLLDALRDAGSDASLIVDGASGEVVVAPDPDDLERLDATQASQRAAHQRDLDEATLPAETLDGTAVTLLANIGGPSEVEEAIELGARGVGLFRTEFLFLERRAEPSEDEQAEGYQAVVAAFAPHPVTIRLLDVGGDKPIPYLPIVPEENPFLGVRALRLAAERPELFVTQLRACYRAATAGNVKVMAPMVADASDVSLLIDLAARARDGLSAEGREIGDVDLGVMLEIPAAVLVADSYLDRLAFASLGTNDLTQYALAVDRGNASLERYRDSLHPAVLHLVKMAVDAAARKGIELSVCGEMAGDRAAALALVGLGVRVLSMAPVSLPAVRRAIRGSRRDALEAAALAALDDAGATDVRTRFDQLIRDAD